MLALLAAWFLIATIVGLFGGAFIFVGGREPSFSTLDALTSPLPAPELEPVLASD